MVPTTLDLRVVVARSIFLITALGANRVGDYHALAAGRIDFDTADLPWLRIIGLSDVRRQNAAGTFKRKGVSRDAGAHVRPGGFAYRIRAPFPQRVVVLLGKTGVIKNVTLAAVFGQQIGHMCGNIPR